MHSPVRHVRHLPHNSLRRNAVWMLVGQGLSVVLRAAYFVLLARVLGVKEYGIFVGAFALVSMATPYAGLGSGLLFMRYAGPDPQKFAVYWGNILFSTACTGLLLTIALGLAAPHLINASSASVVFLIGIGECVFQQFVSCTGQVFQSFERLRITALTGLFTSGTRLGAVLVLACQFRHATAWQWACWSLVASALAAIAGAALVTFNFGRPRFTPRLFLSRLGEGFNFSIAGSTQSVYNDIDKTMLSHYGMNVVNGIYTMAYRIVDIATIPITALDAAALPRFFRQSHQDIQSATDLSARLARRAALLGIVLAAAMFFAAPLIPHLIGSGFDESVQALRWLCIIPAFRGVHQLMGSAITGMGFQPYRTVAQFSAAALNLGLNLWLIPHFGWRGAAWSSLATDGSLGVANWILARNLPQKLARRGQNVQVA